MGASRRPLSLDTCPFGRCMLRLLIVVHVSSDDLVVPFRSTATAIRPARRVSNIALRACATFAASFLRASLVFALASRAGVLSESEWRRREHQRR